MCLYDDTLTIINQYYQFYTSRVFQALDAVLRKHNSTPNYLYNLLFLQLQELRKHEEPFRVRLSRMKKQTRFSLDFNSIFKINQEMKRIVKEKKEVQRELLPHLATVSENMVTKINYNAKTGSFPVPGEASLPFLV